MKQYHDIKSQHPEVLLFFQVGDFYELFFDDAKKAAAFLGIALTTRGKHNGEPIPLCGVPLHAKDHYLHKLVKGGFKVALCDQQEEARPGKLVKRAITSILTPGTLTESTLLDEKTSSYLFSFYPDGSQAALLFGELLTAQLWATIIPIDDERLIESELARFFPDELLIPDLKDTRVWFSFFKRLGYYTTMVQGPIEERNLFKEEWLPKFNAKIQQHVGQNNALLQALFYFYTYVKKTQQSSLLEFNHISLYKPDDYLIMDAATQRNLDITKNQQDNGRDHTLFSLMDGAATPMGSRMIKKWLARPLVNLKAIMHRQDAVEALSQDVIALQTLQQILSPLGDLERVIGRIVLAKAQPYDYVALKRSLKVLPSLLQQVGQYHIELFSRIYQHCDNFSALAELLDAALCDEPTTQKIIKGGFDKQLDHMRQLIEHTNETLLALEKKEQDSTRIASLKVRYNNIHGYYIEVTNANKDLIPSRYIRRQTLVGKERFITPELQQLAYDIERAHAQVDERQNHLFEHIKRQVAQWHVSLRKLAHALAHLDALFGFAKIAYNHGYIRPTFHDGHDILIKEGRHPIVEKNNTNGFIPNDTDLTNEQSLWVITGPNMGGKSTYLRQVALINIMAQCGSFIPAKQAKLPILDKVFTRIGAGDNLAAGKSTFLIEMEETASICIQATERSLVILDEVGRGTSTFDGLAIAQAVIEYLYQQVKARCLFATHYHELTQLSKQYDGIESFYVASRQSDHGIIFLYKIVKGVADGSFGVEVAKLAHLPERVIKRAKELLESLTRQEQIYVSESDFRLLKKLNELQQANMALQEKLLHASKASNKQIEDALASLNLEECTPKRALDFLWHLKDQIG